MNALIVYANYKPHSFNYVVRELLAESFNKNNYDVAIRDLYDIKFNPVLSRNDLESMDNHIFPIDIMDEHKYIQWADVICFTYPLWWSGMPAILKGYIERVFSQGFAFDLENSVCTPLLTNKKVMLFNTTGSNVFFKKDEHKKALNLITEKSIFGFCGMDVVAHEYFESVSRVSPEKREEYKDTVVKTVEDFIKNKD